MVRHMQIDILDNQCDLWDSIGGEGMKTIKQVADELGKSKTAVSTKIKALGIKDSLVSQDGVFLINAEQESQIVSAFRKKQPQTTLHQFAQTFPQTVSENFSETSETTLHLLNNVIITLQQQLEIKDKQLEEHQQTIQKLTTMLEMSQALHQTAAPKRLSDGKKGFFGLFKSKGGNNNE